MGLLASANNRRRSVFYGWWVVISCASLHVLSAGFFYYGLGNFFLPLINEFGWSRAMTSLVYSLYRLQEAIISPAIGAAFDRFGPRKLTAFGMTLAGVAFLVFSQTSSYEMFLISVLMMSAGMSIGIGSTGLMTIANWFVRRRTLAMGLVMAGAGLGGALVALTSVLIETYGWRMTAVFAGFTLFAVGWPLAFVVRHRPEDVGLLPDGETAESLRQKQREDAISGKKRDVIEASYQAARAIRTRNFWLLALGGAFSMVALSALMTHSIPHVVASGLPPTVAASVLAAMTIISVFGRIGFGWLGDRLPKRYLLGALYSLQVAGVVVFANAVETWQVILFLLIYAPSYGGSIPLRPSIQAEYFGRGSFGAIQGMLVACTAAGGIVGPVFAGWMFDILGSYTSAFYILAAINALAVPATFLLTDPTEPVPIKALA